MSKVDEIMAIIDQQPKDSAEEFTAKACGILVTLMMHGHNYDTEQLNAMYAALLARAPAYLADAGLMSLTTSLLAQSQQGN